MGGVLSSGRGFVLPRGRMGLENDPSTPVPVGTPLALPSHMTNSSADIAQHLLRHPVFAAVPRELLDSVAQASQLRRYDAGEAVTQFGRAHNHVVVLVTGAIEAHVRAANGDRFLSGLYFGPALLGDETSDGAWRISTRTLQPSVTVWIERAAFERMIDLDHHAAAAMYRETRRRVERNIRVIEIFACRDVRERILQLLWDLASPSETPDEAAFVQVSRMHLARSLASDRKTIERNLKKLANEGVVRISGKRIGLLGDRRTGDGPRARRSVVSTWRHGADTRARQTDLCAATVQLSALGGS